MVNTGGASGHITLLPRSGISLTSLYGERRGKRRKGEEEDSGGEDGEDKVSTL